MDTILIIVFTVLAGASMFISGNAFYCFFETPRFGFFAFGIVGALGCAACFVLMVLAGWVHTTPVFWIIAVLVVIINAILGALAG